MSATTSLAEPIPQPIFTTAPGTSVPTTRRQPGRRFVVAGLIAGASVFGTLPVPTPADAEALRAAVSTTRSVPGIRPPTTVDGRGVASVLHRLRQSAQLNWGDVADALGVSRRTIHNWLSGAPVAATHLTRLLALKSLVDEAGSGDPAATRIRLTEPGLHGRSLLDGFALASRPGRKVPLSTVSAADLLGGDVADVPSAVGAQAPSRRSSLRSRPVPRRRPHKS